MKMMSRFCCDPQTQIMEVLKKKRTRGAALRKGANLKNHLMHEKIKNKSGQGKRFKPDMKRCV